METKDILKSLRKSNGYSTMQEFCAAADISFSTYQNYESGKRVPTAEILVKLADFYGVTTDYLLGRPDAKAPADLIRAAAAERQLTSAQQGILATAFLCYLIIPHFPDFGKMIFGKEVLHDTAKEIRSGKHKNVHDQGCKDNGKRHHG